MTTRRSTEHYTFTLERTYAASAARVFAAWADPDARASWRIDGDYAREYELDFSVGGGERISGNMPDGRPFSSHGVIHDIVADERIVFSYEMYLSGERASVSLATVEIVDADDEATLTLTEHGVLLDAIVPSGWWEQGTGSSLDSLGEYLTVHA